VSSSRRRVPSVRSVDHVAYTVPDLDVAVAFFCDHLGAELVYEDGPFSASDDSMRQRLNVDPRAVCRLAMLRFGPTLNLELFQYEAPGQNQLPPRNSDIGGGHLALYVDDIDAAHDYVKQIPGVVVQGGPHDVLPTAPVSGQRWFYFQTPWGLQMELTSDSSGTFYRGLPASGLVHPSDSWDAGR
jgi:catechol 2,3-dioxygenase-like lactoylglutathione lyase family enzyme